MIGRWVPPVYSPVSAASLAAGVAAAAGLSGVSREAVRARIGSLFDARDVVLTDSGTSALVLALRAIARSSPVVAFPAYVCIDLTAAARRAGVAMRLYDLDPATMSADIASLRAACARGVHAIVVAPLYGYPIDMPAVVQVAREYDVPVIEDAAQSAGAELGATRVGAFGDLSVLSFGRGKGTTAGSGGALLVHNPVYADAIGAHAPRPAQRGWRALIPLAAQWALARPPWYALPASIPFLKLGEMVYHDAREPRSMSWSAARILGVALAADPDEVRHRRRCADGFAGTVRHSRAFAAIAPILGATPGYLRFAVRDIVGRAEPVPRLGALRGYPMTLDQHPQTQSVLLAGESAGPGARTLRDRLFTVPTHSRVAMRDVDSLTRWLGADEAKPAGGRGAAAGRL